MTDELAALFAEADAAERLRASIAADPRPLHGPAYWPGSIAITRDTTDPDGWRMTYFDPAVGRRALLGAWSRAGEWQRPARRGPHSPRPRLDGQRNTGATLTP